jgi:hypothetical protein
MPAASKSACSNGAPSWCGGPALTGPEGLDEWSLVGLTRDQGIARWSALFMGRPPVSRMTMSTNLGVGDMGAGRFRPRKRRADVRTPPPLLVEIAVSDPDSTRDRLSPRSPTDSVTTAAWCGQTGLIAGGVTGFGSGVSPSRPWCWLSPSRRELLQRPRCGGDSPLQYVRPSGSCSTLREPAGSSRCAHRGCDLL